MNRQNTVLELNIFDDLRGQLRRDEPMSKHTSWRVGGAAQYFYIPENRHDLQQLLLRLPDNYPLTFMGLGSNTLVRDAGISGLVISTLKGLDQIDYIAPDFLYAEAGVSCAKVAKQLANYGLTGVEFLAGVPGTFGGALVMNAGAFGGEIWQWVESIEFMARSGEVTELHESQVSRSYRHVQLPKDSFVIAAKLRLQTVSSDQSDVDSKNIIRQLLDKRSASQPIQTANAGSVFTNPDGMHAAKLIEQCGLKGYVIGDAQVSMKHANFIVNRGQASANDIEQLIAHVKNTVAEQTGVELKPEVRFIGGEQ